jgi:hypothetical protein
MEMPDAEAAKVKPVRFSIELIVSGLDKNNEICPGQLFTVQVGALNAGGQPLGDGLGQKEFKLVDPWQNADTVVGAKASFEMKAPQSSGIQEYRIEFHLNRQKQFDTSFSILVKSAIPVFTSSLVKSVTGTTAKFITEVNTECEGLVQDKGACWNETPSPTLDDHKISAGPATGKYSVDFKELKTGTSYYARGYAITSSGVTYGDEVIFTTIGIPNVTTGEVSLVTGTSALGSGNVVSTGGSDSLIRGVCWSKNPDPLIETAFSATSPGSTGSYSVKMTELSPNTTYYVKAFAKNEAGISYGSQRSFFTYASVRITTSQIYSVTPFSAVSGGIISSDGGSPVIQRGVCWSGHQAPTINDFKSIDGSGIGTFTSNITGLQSYTFYWVRAYAITAIGVYYGNELMLLTEPGMPPAPILAFPANGATIGCCSVDLQWLKPVYKDEPGFTPTYNIQVSTNINFIGSGFYVSDCSGSIPLKAGVVNYFTTKQPGICFKMGSVSLNGTWYWRVQALNSLGYPSQWSAVRSFTYNN